MIVIETDRLILRSWKETDAKSLAKINRDPRVMKYMPNLLTAKQTQQAIIKMQTHIDKYGYGVYACEIKWQQKFIGFVGLNKPQFESSFMAATEILWRIDSQFWNIGYASEAAKAILALGFTNLLLPEIISFTYKNNGASRRVMEKIGLKEYPDQAFQHPLLDKNHPLSHHVFYKLCLTEYNG